MPRGTRACSFCDINKDTSPNVTIFTVEAEDGSRKLVCEKHFLDSDIQICGNMKRLASGAVLKVWDEQHEKVHAEHDYGRTDKTKEKAEGSDDSDEVI